MYLRKLFNLMYVAIMTILINLSVAFAAETETIDKATDDFSDKMLTLFKGPLVKILAGVVLFVGVGGLLRGKHNVAVSCGIAFVLLLMLPVVLKYFGG